LLGEHASELYAKNQFNLIELFVKDKAINLDWSDEVLAKTALTHAGETVEHGGVRVIGPVNLPATVAYHASEMYAKYLLNFINPAFKDGSLAIDWNDEVFAAACVTHDGAIRHEPTRKSVEGA
jgi:NAD(P) transhydrogenase subunit alpha